jgi:hypothetical protein
MSGSPRCTATSRTGRRCSTLCWSTPLDESSERLAAAELENVPFAEGVARVCRALVASRSKYALLARMVDHVDKGKAEPRLGDPIRALLRKGVAEGSVREDLSEDEMAIVLGALVQAASYLVSQSQAGPNGRPPSRARCSLTGPADPSRQAESCRLVLDIPHLIWVEL